MKWRPTIAAGLICAAAAGVVLWVIHARLVGHWLEVHTGTVNEPGPYYGFWSGFGSDLTEFGIIGAIATAVYQLVRKYNCHEPGCWRVGNHPAAGGQFSLCYRHHPDYQGKSQPASSSSGCTVSTWSARRRSTASSIKSTSTRSPGDQAMAVIPGSAGATARHRPRGATRRTSGHRRW